MADPACGCGSISTLPKECSLSLSAAYRGLLLGSPFPFSLTPFAITIYLSLEVAGTRACSRERLVEPVRESEAASVWAQCLPLMGQGEKALPCKVGWETGSKGHGAGKGATHTSRAKTRGRRWQLATFFGNAVNDKE